MNRRRSGAAPSRTIVAAATRYFGIVFGAGFLLGLVRVPFLVPRLGERVAELVEMPLMLAVVYFAARHVVRRNAGRLGARGSTLVGALALLMLLIAEIGLVALQGRGIAEYVASRDPVSGGAYLLSLAAYAAMPWFVSRRRGSRA